MRNLHAAARTTAPLMLNSATEPLSEAQASIVWARGQRRAALTNSVQKRCQQLPCEGFNRGITGAGVEAVC